MVRTAALILLLLVGCTSVQEKIINVPVYRMPEVPSELMVEDAPSAPIFISPRNREAVVGLNKAGKDALVEYIDRLSRKLEAFRAWVREGKNG